MSDEVTCGCGQPTRDNARICDDCVDELTKALAEIPSVDDEITTTITRQVGSSLEGGSRSANHGLPWHDKASTARRDLHNTLVSWVRVCHEEGVRREGGSDMLPTDNLQAMSRWLLCRIPGLRFHEAADEARQEIADAVAECWRIVFWKRRARVYLGRCEVIHRWHRDGERCDETAGCPRDVEAEQCTGDIYAEPDEPVGHCETCATGVTVAIRKAALERELDNRLCTAAEIAWMATFLGLDVPRDRVRNQVTIWHKRRHIMSAGSTDDGSPLYRYSEVRALLAKTYDTDTTTVLASRGPS